jgi:hypothetical protein
LRSDPAFAVPAELPPSRLGAAGVTITVMERAMAIDAFEEFELGTLSPGAFFRRRELDQAGITTPDLDGGPPVFRRAELADRVPRAAAWTGEQVDALFRAAAARN